ncbi:hypothetical protein F6X40_11220 [Paraburkholderia sp. UCT31]|uniref:hypothetical protein n=1 Tax=Paraburkholderia sp. UCT31 TaxID=2615209 RepID=UPI0016555CF0|nr:hypothetical protein [Paraburkholderia sp. UCT31]MBC8737374.1 hypothetical protein [Paraburkholderia sp. UCT31]
MSPQLYEFIRQLSAADKKTLVGKALKTSEEVGELAKKVLPFENAHATTHRVVEKRDILEEACDTVLCAMSIVFDLGFNEADFEEMLFRKGEKWASLQARESGVKYPLPFELHVTVSLKHRDHMPAALALDAFRSACHQLDVKPVVLALQDRAGATVLQDVMTSSVFSGDNRHALDELNRISTHLNYRGFEVVRRKLETVPWHPAAPSSENGVSVMPPGGYFESHVAVVMDLAEGGAEEALVRKRLEALATAHGAHLSRNAFKQLSPTAFTVMMTLRAYDGTREAFETARDALTSDLRAGGFAFEKVITEFSLFDSKSSHDSAWLAA